MNRPSAFLAAGVLLAAVLAGCVNLEPRPDPTRYYTIPLPEAGPAALPEDTRGQPEIGLRRVDLPESATSRKIATATGPREMAFSEYERWAEPVEDMVARALAERWQGTGAARVVDLPPWRDGATPGLIVELEFLRFEAHRSGEVVLHAQYWVSLPPPENGGYSGHFHWEEAAWDGADHGQLAAAYGRALAALADQLAVGWAAPQNAP